jgi:small subunit ribosomal protein S17
MTAEREAEPTAETAAPSRGSGPAGGSGLAPDKKERGQRKVRTGVVVSDKMNKTVVVRIEQSVRHATYHKTVRRTAKLTAHDEKDDAHVGDTVRVMETRPLSKTKRWRVVEVIERAK